MVQKKIFCVDDESFNLDLIEESLEAAGYAVSLVENGQQALEQLKAKPTQFKAVLLDCIMPDIGGQEVLKQVKQISSLEGLPIIMQTGLSEKEGILEAEASETLFPYFLWNWAEMALSDLHMHKHLAGHHQVAYRRIMMPISIGGYDATHP